MNTLNAYQKKFSSIAILALLAFSAFSAIILIAPATPVRATTVTPPKVVPTIVTTTWYPGGSSNWVYFNVTNPISNMLGINQFTITAPAGWSINGCGEEGPSYFLDTCAYGATAAVYSIDSGLGPIPPGNTEVFELYVLFATGTTYPVSGAFTTSFEMTDSNFYAGNSLTLNSWNPVAYYVTITTTATLPFVAGSTPIPFTAQLLLVDDSTPAAVAGVPIAIEPEYGTGTVSGSGLTLVAGNVWVGYTDSTGAVTGTYTPSNKAGTDSLYAVLSGTNYESSYCHPTQCEYWTSSSLTVQTIAGPPSSIAFTFSSYASDGNHYITTEATTSHTTTAYPSGFTGARTAPSEILYAIADQFGNPLPFSAVSTYTITLTASASNGGGLFNATGLPSVITCTTPTSGPAGSWHAGTPSASIGGSCPSHSTSEPVAIPFYFYQSPIWGTTGQIVGTITGTYSSASFSGSGNSNFTITSTFDTATSPTPEFVYPAGTTVATTASVKAGDMVNVTVTIGAPSTCGSGSTLCPVQQGVPMGLFLDQTITHSWETSGTIAYGAHTATTPALGFSNGYLNTTSLDLVTNAAGKVSALFTVDTCATQSYCPTGAHAKFISNASAPYDGGLTATLAPSSDSGYVTTIAGATNSLTATLYFTYTAVCTGTCHPHHSASLTNPTTTVAASTSTYNNSPFVNVVISDKYGNLAINPGPSNIGLTLTVSGGILTDYSPTISASCADIAGIAATCTTPFGPIQWTMPTSYPATLTLTASGDILGNPVTNTTTISLVSPMPTFAVTSPALGVNGVIYSMTTSVVFKGQANVSLGYGPTDLITGVTYSIDGGKALTASITSSGHVTFIQPAIFTKGLHTIAFNATDTNSNKFIGTSSNNGMFTVLVDTLAPTIKFVTPAKAEVNFTNPLTFTVNDLQGDMGVVSVKYNGTTLAQSLITVNPSVNSTSTLGDNTTYTVTASLPSGKWSVTVGAITLAGKAATTKTETVTASITTDLTFSSSGSGLPTSTTESGFQGISTTFTNNAGTSITAQFWIQFTGPTTEAFFQGATIGPGSSTTVFFGTAGLAPGSYTATVYVSVGLTPYSPAYTVTFTVS